MTRRIVKPQPPKEAVAPVLENGWWMWQRFNAERRHFDGKTTEKLWDRRCPYGVPGDRLWVKETFYETESAPFDDGKLSVDVLYRADGDFDGDMHHAGCKWQPSIHMPRWASRITLEVTSVRIERLQDISVEDAIAEGVPTVGVNFVDFSKEPDEDGFSDPRASFETLWESLHGPGSWDANPWLWVIWFKRIEAAHG